ncbi:MAG: hypothetical protein PSX80_01480 [bacterium]|nr:hypothetical protein [bacterium]
MEGTSNRNGLSNTFLENLPSALGIGDSDAENLLLREYGAVFVARGGAVPPDRVVFVNAKEVERFQTELKIGEENIGGFRLELQAPAMDALRRAIAEAESQKLSITPRGRDSARRSYDETIELWASRVDPALTHWVEQGRLTNNQAEAIKSLSPFEQVPEVLQLEQQGIWFAKDLSKSIIYSVAPPGTSQHLSLLAFDVAEFDDPLIREILAREGWFQTVVSDLPHFTYLGVHEAKLPQLGLKRSVSAGFTFWAPDM